MKICIDAGHGGHDSGALSAAGAAEKDYTLAQANVAHAILMREGHEVATTRATDIYVPLPERARIANREEADAFISFHWNVASTITPSGTIVMVHEHAPTRTYQLGNLLLNEVAPVDGVPEEKWDRLWAVPDHVPGSRWERGAPLVLHRTKMPALILEVEFATHPEAAELLSNDNPEYLVGVAEAVGRALARWEA